MQIVRKIFQRFDHFVGLQVYCCGRYEPSSRTSEDVGGRPRNSASINEMDKSLTRAHSSDSLNAHNSSLTTSPQNAQPPLQVPTVYPKDGLLYCG